MTTPEAEAVHYTIVEENVDAANQTIYTIEPPISILDSGLLAFAITDGLVGDGEGLIDPMSGSRGQDEWGTDRANHRISFGTPDNDLCVNQIIVTFPLHHRRHHMGKARHTLLREVVEQGLQSVSNINQQKMATFTAARES